MKVKTVIGAIAASLAISGCATSHSPFPRAQAPETEYQQKIQAAAHWDVLAANEADLIAGTLGSGTSISFDASSDKSDFGDAYQKMLTQHLLKNGLQVLDSGGTYSLKYQAQVITHKDRDKLATFGLLTGATASAFFIAHVADKWGTPALGVIPFAVGADALSYHNEGAPTPNTEVLMTTEVRMGNRIAQSSTRIYYFNPGDKSLYSETETETGKTFSVTGMQ